MSINLLCDSFGANSGTTNCPVVPGIGKYLVIWGGKLTPTQLLQGIAIQRASLIADSKRSKYDSEKLLIFPVAHDFRANKEANTEVALPDGYKQAKREGIPSYEIDVITDLYQGPKLRALNNKQIRYGIIDDKKQFLATFDSDGNMVGRAGTIYMEGIDAVGYDTNKADGQVTVRIQAGNAYETYDTPTALPLGVEAPTIFKSLKDIQMYEKTAATLTSATAPTRTVTVTAVGSDGSTIDIPAEDGTSITGGPVEKTASETTGTLMAAKIVTAITDAANGYSATNLAGVVTITGPTVLGSTVNATDTALVITGSLTASKTAWTGGVSGHYVFHISGKMSPSPIANTLLDFYTEYGASALGTDESLWKFVRTDTGETIAVNAVAPSGSEYFSVIPTTATIAGLPRGTVVTYNLVAPPLLDAANILNIEGIAGSWTKP